MMGFFPLSVISRFPNTYNPKPIVVKISKSGFSDCAETSLFGHKSADNPFFSCAEYSSDALHMALNYSPIARSPFVCSRHIGISSGAGIVLDLPLFIYRQLDAEKL